MAKTLVLYQRWPGRKIGRFQVSEESLPTTAMSSFPLSMAGIAAAITVADRKDAKLVVLNKEYKSSEKFKRAVEKKVSKGKYKLLFQPVAASEVING